MKKMKKIYSYHDMKADLKVLSESYPEILRVFRLARTADGRWMYGIRFGNSCAKKRFVIQASMHAREWFNTELIMRMVRRACRQWQKNIHYQGIDYRKLLDGVCFFILPMVNPDGVAISQKGPKGIRDDVLRTMIKESGGTYLYWKANARGVDLNRNYSTGFAADTRREKGSKEYAGKRPFSERETRALVKLIHTVKPMAVINYHSAGHLLYYKEDNWLVRLAKRLTGYKLCQETGEPNGNLGDWLSKNGICWCTIETCVGKAPAGRWQLPMEWKKHKNLLAEIALIIALPE